MQIKILVRSSLMIAATCIGMLCVAQDSLSWALATIAVTRNGHEIGIGDKIPDIPFQKILNHAPGSSSVAQLNNKPMIIEFWHQYCSTCRSEIPKLNNLYTQFKDSVQFLMVTFQSEADTRSFMHQQAVAGKPVLPPVVVEDTLLRKTFGHEGDPHVVWVAGDGTVQAITSNLALSEQHIEQWLRDKDIRLATKSNSRYINTDEPLLIRGDEDQSADKKYYARFTGYIDSITAVYFHVTEMQNNLKVLIINSTIDQLFKEFYMRYDTSTIRFLDVDWMNKRILYRYDDSSCIFNWSNAYNMGYDQLEDFQQKHMFSFELMSNDTKDMSEISGHALKELTRLLHIRASIQTVPVNGLALVLLDNKERYKYKGRSLFDEGALQDSVMASTGEGMRSLVNIINLHYEMPLVVDETGYTGKTDVIVPNVRNDIPALRQRLQQYGLGLVPKTYQLKMLVLEDE